MTLTDSEIKDYLRLVAADFIGPIIAAGTLVSIIAHLKKAWERQFIERVCIGGPMD